MTEPGIELVDGTTIYKQVEHNNDVLAASVILTRHLRTAFVS